MDTIKLNDPNEAIATIVRVAKVLEAYDTATQEEYAQLRHYGMKLEQAKQTVEQTLVGCRLGLEQHSQTQSEAAEKAKRCMEEKIRKCEQLAAKVEQAAMEYDSICHDEQMQLSETSALKEEGRILAQKLSVLIEKYAELR